MKSIQQSPWPTVQKQSCYLTYETLVGDGTEQRNCMNWYLKRDSVLTRIWRLKLSQRRVLRFIISGDVTPYRFRDGYYYDFESYINFLKPTGYVTYQQFNIQQL